MPGVCLSLNGRGGPVPMDKALIEVLAELIDPFLIAFDDDDFVPSF